jgi:hypothetical protein
MKTPWMIIFGFKRKINGNILFNLRENKSLLPQNKMLPGRIVGVGAFDEGVENSIKFILHGFS